MGVFSHTSVDREGKSKRHCSQWQAGLERMSAKSGKEKRSAGDTPELSKDSEDDLFVGKPIALNETMRDLIVKKKVKLRSGLCFITCSRGAELSNFRAWQSSRVRGLLILLGEAEYSRNPARWHQSLHANE